MAVHYLYVLIIKNERELELDTFKLLLAFIDLKYPKMKFKGTKTSTIIRTSNDKVSRFPLSLRLIDQILRNLLVLIEQWISI